ncbi:hypothetical protein GCM10011533_34660 [Streptosporangium jomthongense]|nr:hypothetical protein GCM10011533_34660 [Streptosporangium jomthongense]
MPNPEPPGNTWSITSDNYVSPFSEACNYWTNARSFQIQNQAPFVPIRPLEQGVSHGTTEVSRWRFHLYDVRA